MGAADWGDVPTWIGAVGTCAGVVFAAVAGIIAYMLYMRESARDERAAADRREQAEQAKRQQAALVCAWYGFEEREDYIQRPRHFEIALGRKYRAWGAIVLNASSMPIYDVVVDFHFSSPKINDGQPAGGRGQANAAIVPPGEQLLKIPDSTLRDVEDKSLYVVTLTFRDAANHRWRRALDGTLEPA